MCRSTTFCHNFPIRVDLRGGRADHRIIQVRVKIYVINLLGRGNVSQIPIFIVCSLVSLPCDSSPCQNDGTCSNNGQLFACTCLAGFEGLLCENEGKLLEKNLGKCWSKKPGLCLSQISDTAGSAYLRNHLISRGSVGGGVELRVGGFTEGLETHITWLTKGAIEANSKR